MFQDPPLEIYHVGHKLGVQHASFIARDLGGFVKHASLALVGKLQKLYFCCSIGGRLGLCGGQGGPTVVQL